MFTKLYLLVTLELLSFILNLLSPTKSLPENFKFVSTLDLMPRFLRLYTNDCFCLWHLNLIITLSDLFMLWQACKSSETTWILVSDSALQILSLKHEFQQKQEQDSAETGFISTVSLLLYWELVTALRSSWMILVIRWE